MKVLTKDQKKLLGEFCVNFAIAWFTIGVISPVLSESTSWFSGAFLLAVIFGGFFLTAGVLLVKGK